MLQLCRLYAKHGLIDVDNPQPLCQIWVNAGPCWAPAAHARRESPDGDGSLCLPWIGPGYEPGGEVIVAVNPTIGFKDQTGLLTEYWISRLQHIRKLADGYYKNDGSRFAYGAY